MGTTLTTRFAIDRLERLLDGLVAVSSDLDAFMWEVENVLRDARTGYRDSETIQRLCVRAERVLAATDGVRAQLPPRLGYVLGSLSAEAVEHLSK